MEGLGESAENHVLGEVAILKINFSFTNEVIGTQQVMIYHSNLQCTVNQKVGRQLIHPINQNTCVTHSGNILYN